VGETGGWDARGRDRGDLVRSRAQLLAESALLRQQLLVLRRSVTRPAVTRADRALLVLLAGRVRAGRRALLLLQPATLLGWHRAGFRALWRRKSRPRPGRPPLAAETVALIQRLAGENPLWGAERIRGELRKLGERVAKRTIQAHRPATRAPRSRGQSWATFLQHHAHAVWACDCLPITDRWFRPLFAYVVVALGSRRVVHVGVTRHPTDAWVAQQRREATPFSERPHFLIGDNDAKYGAHFDRVAAASGIGVLRANATGERFLGSVRRECLDHLLVLGEHHLRRVLRKHVASFNQERSHQGIGQATPERSPGTTRDIAAPVRAVRVLGGLHHAYQRAA
jgi:hypothetical protein